MMKLPAISMTCPEVQTLAHAAIATTKVIQGKMLSWCGTIQSRSGLAAFLRSCFAVIARRKERLSTKTSTGVEAISSYDKLHLEIGYVMSSTNSWEGSCENRLVSAQATLHSQYSTKSIGTDGFCFRSKRPRAGLVNPNMDQACNAFMLPDVAWLLSSRRTLLCLCASLCLRDAGDITACFYFIRRCSARCAS